MSNTVPSRSTRAASVPFDAPDADIILRSVDGVDFRTYKNYLIQALHGFDDLLQVGHLNGIGESEEMQDGRLIVPLPESSPVLDLFLRVLYPVNFGCPDLGSHLTLLPGVCQALSKYCVKNFPLSVKDALMLAADKDPELVYVISCRYTTLSDVAKFAAKNTLRKAQRLDNVSQNMVPELSAMQYHAIVTYQVACRAAAMNGCILQTWSTQIPVLQTPGATPVRGSDADSGCTCLKDRDSMYFIELMNDPEYPDVNDVDCVVPDWLMQYLEDVRKDLQNGDEISGSVALKPEHLAKAIDAGKGCVVCGKEVGKFLRFAQLVRDWIDNEVRQIAFHPYAVDA